jgi:hypothetical protein
MSFNFGGPVQVETVTDETVAGRYARDVSNRGVENQYTTVVGGNVRDGSSATVNQIAATATGGRTDRAYLKRGGDKQLTFDPANPETPTVVVDADGRNDREYVDPTTGISQLDTDGTKGDLFDELKAGPTLYF